MPEQQIIWFYMAGVETRNFSVSVKDLIFIIGIVFSFAGNWFSLNARVREFEIMHEADKRIRDAQIETLKIQVSAAQLSIEQLKQFQKK